MEYKKERRKALGRYIAAARRPKNQQWLADKLGMWQGSISAWERGASQPSPENIEKLEQVLKIDPGTLESILYETPQIEQKTIDRAKTISALGMLTDDQKITIDMMISQLLIAQGLDPDDPRLP